MERRNESQVQVQCCNRNVFRRYTIDSPRNLPIPEFPSRKKNQALSVRSQLPYTFLIFVVLIRTSLEDPCFKVKIILFFFIALSLHIFQYLFPPIRIKRYSSRMKTILYVFDKRIIPTRIIN